MSKLSPFSKKAMQEADFYWQTTDTFKGGIKCNLRPLVAALDFSSTHQDNPWLSAINWIKEKAAKTQKLATPIVDCPDKTIPTKLQPYLTSQDDKKSTHINPNRYEYWIYRRLYENLKTGKIYLEETLEHRSLSQELVSLDQKNNILQQLDIPALSQPINEQLDGLFAELDQLWNTFNKELKKGKLKHLYYNEKEKTLHLQKTKINKDDKKQHHFYEQLPFADIVDILKWVSEHSHFLAALTHLQPRYAKQAVKSDYLLATILAQGMNNGNLNMSNISSIPYPALQDTLQSRLRLATLKAANDLISKSAAKVLTN